jgi:hypothetical protein
MTMYFGLDSSDAVEDLSFSNGNRTKPWKQYRDQIVRLGPACDAANKADDIGLTTDKLRSTPPQRSAGDNGLLASTNRDDDENAADDDGSSRSNRSSRVSREEEGSRDRMALAARFLESEELFTDAERFLILQKCALVASCLWAEVGVRAARLSIRFLNHTGSLVSVPCL